MLRNRSNYYVFNIRHVIVEKPILVTSLRNASMCRAHPKLLWSPLPLMIATFHGSSCIRRLRARVGPCVRYIRVHVRILILPRQLLACLLACVRRGLVTLPHSNPHSRASPRSRAQVLTRISPFRATSAFHGIGFVEERERISIPWVHCNSNTRNREPWAFRTRASARKEFYWEL